MNGKQRILAVIDGNGADHLPFMPITMSFSAHRNGVKFGDYAGDYRVLVETQIRTAEELDFDHVSCISDPGREAADCGAAVETFEDQPPALDESRALLKDKVTLAKLAIPDPLGGGRMHDRVNAVAAFSERLGGEKLIEGWVEGPCAEAADLRGINTIMLDFYDDPDFVRDLFDFILEMELRFARAQVDAGADVIGVGDAAASLVGPKIYDELIWPYEKKLIDGIRAMNTRVRLHICGRTGHIFQGIGRLGCDIVDLDYLAPIDQARETMGSDQTLLGNVDPVSVLRDSSPAKITEAITKCHRQAGPRYVVSAGCEVPRDTPLENLLALRDYAQSHTPECCAV